ncbi:patatin-like phospholipase RssA [Sinimarinibacterium sp. CAU 1509]|uniref:patatin-like phospholipase RssA n=1 Tax=Sinimarinibacterium sp. CAU 1509 TaxID=2562283 RepID=UPI0010ABCBB2|nr:patatin-like phospholipase RssA [Sinimarinibacterium sp. CAU 1509]TJY61917.1 patatin-like phospholipase RssA [Sinimarinibacterium sp. CAU 1509]
MDAQLSIQSRTPVVGLALGSGSARGWAHIGVIQALEQMGVRPMVVAGTSIGALVGAVYVSGQLDAFSAWVQKLTAREVLGFLDLSFSGGFVKGERLFAFFEEQHSNPQIEALGQRYVSVCTEMQTGREIWITQGPILPAARASCALPGLFSPVRYEQRWMLDGGLVNPVPVSACRALGAEVVIAVNLNAQLVGSHFSRVMTGDAESGAEAGNGRSWWQKAAGYLSSGSADAPSVFDVMATSVNILQDRVTRSRMAGDPPELTLVPMLEDFALMDFHRAPEAIAEGRRLVEENAEMIRAWIHRATP